MSGRPKLTESELAVIIDHVTPLLDGVTKSLNDLPHYATGDEGRYIASQRKYLKQAIGTLKWVIGTAKQRGETTDGNIGPSVRRPGEDSV